MDTFVLLPIHGARCGVWLVARQLGINLTGLKLGQTELSARFNESGIRPIATLSARQVMLVLAGCRGGERESVEQRRWSAKRRVYC